MIDGKVKGFVEDDTILMFFKFGGDFILLAGSEGSVSGEFISVVADLTLVRKSRDGWMIGPKKAPFDVSIDCICWCRNFPLWKGRQKVIKIILIGLIHCKVEKIAVKNCGRDLVPIAATRRKVNISM